MTAVLCAAAVAAVGTAAVAAAYLFMILPARHRRGIPFLLATPIAHRALHDADGVCENSIPAVRAAISQALTIEADVRLTRDGVPVVIHDSSLSRLCGISRSVESMTLAELSECRLLEGGSRIPTLAELLREVDGRVPLLIELKSSYRSRVAASAADILAGYTGHFAVQSFDPICLRRFKRLLPHVPVGILACRKRLSSGIHAYASSKLLFNFLCRPDFISFGYTERPPLALRLARRMGCPVLAWTVTSAKQASLAASHFDGIIAERFDKIAPVRDS